MAKTPQPHMEVISPAEARFWQEQAGKMPARLRNEYVQKFNAILSSMTPYTVGGIGVGAVLGVASCTRHVPGKWKIAGGLSAVGAMAVGVIAGGMQYLGGKAPEAFAKYADALEKDPALQQKLADFLSNTITADEIQAIGEQNAIMQHTLIFGSRAGYLQANGQQLSCIPR